MSIPLEDNSVLPLVREYRDCYVEQQAILAEIKNFRKRYDKRLKDIKARIGDLESDIMAFMQEKGHPGLRFQEMIFLQEDKVLSKNNKHREEEVQSILQKYRVDPTNPLYRELLESSQTSKARESIKRLKMKMYKKTESS